MRYSQSNNDKQLTLQDVCEFIADCPHSTAPDEGVGYPIIRTPNVGKGRLILEGVQRVSQETYDKRNKRAIPQANDIIFAREAPAGNAAIICEGQEVCLGQRTVLIRPNSSKVCPAYLVYYLLSPREQYELLGTANGATVAHVNIPVIKNLPVTLPDMATQQKIADILSAYDDLIENNQKQIKLLEEAAQRLYKEWFVDFRFPGHEQAKFIDGLPEGWHKGNLSDIAEFLRGKVITAQQVTNGNIPVIAGGMEPAYFGDKSNTAAPVITVSGSGNAGFVMLHHEKVWASDCSYLDFNHSKELYFVYCFLKRNQQYLYSLQKGSCQQHVKPSDINGIEMTIPSSEVIQKFCVYVASCFEAIANCKTKNKLLAQARDILLPKLMSGEIAV